MFIPMLYSYCRTQGRKIAGNRARIVVKFYLCCATVRLFGGCEFSMLGEQMWSYGCHCGGLCYMGYCLVLLICQWTFVTFYGLLSLEEDIQKVCD